MSLEDEQLKNYRKRLKNDNSQIFFDNNSNVIKTKISSKSIINRDDISFKVRSCENNQLKMILFDEGVNVKNCSDLASILLSKIPEKVILAQIENTRDIYKKLVDLEIYKLMRILFDSDIDYNFEHYYGFKSDLISEICENINYKLIEDKINNISFVSDNIISDKISLTNSIRNCSLFDEDFKNFLIDSLYYSTYFFEISRFMVSLSKDKNKKRVSTKTNHPSNVEFKVINKPNQVNSGGISNVEHKRKSYLKKYRVIDNPIKRRIALSDVNLENNPFISEKSNQNTENESYDFDFSSADKKINKALYLYQQEVLRDELKNEAINQIDEILDNISNFDLTEENKCRIHDKIIEIEAFIKKYDLSFRLINYKKRQLDKSFDRFSEKIQENKFKNLKTNVYAIYKELFVNKIDLDTIGNKYPNFYSYISEDEVFNYANELIKFDSDFAEKFKKIVDFFIDKYNSKILHRYNEVIKKLKQQNYIDKRESIRIKSEYNQSVRYLKNLNKLKSYFNNFKKVSFKTFNVDSMIEQHNSKFINGEYIKKRAFFDNFNGYKLDKNQREVVLSDEKVSKIIAGAGSGKTFTLLAKIKYLLDFKNVSPDKILCISYSNASVNDLKDKLEDTIGKNEIDVFTFHKLGGEILKDNDEDYIPNKNLLNETIEKYFEEYIISNPKKVKKIINFFNIYNYNSKNDEKDLHLVKEGNLVDLKGTKEFETLKDKVNQLTDYEFNIKNNDSIEYTKTVDRGYVRSFEELIIANFLFINNLDYIYEDDFFKRKNIIPEEGYTQYRPDFYLPKYNIYIEHFGVDKNLNARHLDAMGRNEYKKSIHWKRRIHKRYRSKLIETYSYENWEGNLLKNLEDKLEKMGVEFSEIDYSRIYDRLIKNKKLDELENVIRIIKDFIDLFKTNGHHIDDMGNEISYKSFSKIQSEIESNTDYLKTRNIFLFEMIRDIYGLYHKQNGVDFNDMINNPIKLLNSKCKLKDYDYIFVDEYQDTSYSRYRLLKEIVDKTNAKLVVVGDDWQSIYSFSGCQIELFTNFEDYFDYSKEFKIQKNYRNSSDLINVSSKFVLKNESQLKKELEADKDYPEKPIKIAKYNYSRDFSLIFEDMIKEISYNNPDGEILILSRYNEDFRYVIVPRLFETDNLYDYEKVLREQGYLKIKYLKDENVKIKFRTIHKSKGLEEDNVILIGLKYKDPKGFPSKIEDDSIIQYVRNKTKEDTLYAEERRLFYVALTRSKNNVYLLTHEKEPSEFIEDLEKLDDEDKIEFRKYRFKNDDINTMNLLMDDKFNRRTKFDTKLKCSKCGEGDIILNKKFTGIGFFRCSACNFDFGAFNQSPELLDTLDYCSVDGCDGLTYINEDDSVERKICSYYGKTGCEGEN